MVAGYVGYGLRFWMVAVMIPPGAEAARLVGRAPVETGFEALFTGRCARAPVYRRPVSSGMVVAGFRRGLKLKPPGLVEGHPLKRA